MTVRVPMRVAVAVVRNGGSADRRISVKYSESRRDAETRTEGRAEGAGQRPKGGDAEPGDLRREGGLGSGLGAASPGRGVVDPRGARRRRSRRGRAQA